MKQTHPCTGCRYFFGAYEGGRCCNYIFIEGHRRPCPPGKECTVGIGRGGRRRRTRGSESGEKRQAQEKVCAHCGKVFFTTYSKKLYCGRKCYEAARNRRKWEKRKDRV